MTFFSVSIGMGGLFTIASYNNFNGNIFLDSVVVSLINDGRKKNILFTCNHRNPNITKKTFVVDCNASLTGSSTDTVLPPYAKLRLP